MSIYDKIVGATTDGLLPPAVLAKIGPAITDTGKAPVGKDETVVRAADHGILAGNTTNSAALTNALAVAASRNVPLVVPPGVYKMTGYVELPENADLRLEPGAVLDWSASGASYYLSVAGSIDSTRVAISGATRGSYTVTAVGHTLTAGAWAKVSSDDKFDSLNTNTPLGELVQVREVLGDSVTFWTPLRDTYTTAPRIQAVTMKSNVRISGGVIRGTKVVDQGRTGLLAKFARNLTVTGTRFENIDTRHIGIDCCVNAWVTDCAFEWTGSSSMGYGVSFANATRDSGVMNCSFLYCRHSLSTNNSATGDSAGVVRRITFAFNRVENSAPAVGGGGGDAIDTHGAAEDIDILHNRVNGAGGSGINVECPSSRIIGNTILGAGTYGISAHNETDRDGEYIITNNTVRGSGAGWSGIRQSSGYRQGAGRCRGVVISNNYVENSDIGIRAGRNAAAPGAVNDDTITITGNTIRSCTGAGISVYRADALTCSGNAMYSTGMGVVVEKANYASIGPDAIRNFDATGFVGIDLKEVARSRVQPGGIRVGTGTGVRIASTCSQMTVGAYSQIFATTPVQNDGPSSVVIGA